MEDRYFEKEFRKLPCWQLRRLAIVMTMIIGQLSGVSSPLKNVTIRNLSDEVHRAIRVRAAENDRSVETVPE